MNTPKLFLIIGFAFITRLLLLFAFPQQDTDYYIINTAAQNLASGHGMGFLRSYITDLSAFSFEGLRLWPPLLPLLLSGFFKIVNNSQIATTFFFIFFLLIFFYFLSKLLNLLKFTIQTKSIVFLFVATNPELIKTPGLTDLAAASFCLAACTVFIKILSATTRKKVFTLLLCSLLFFLPSAFRYQYYPLTYLFPCVLLCYSFYLKDSVLKYHSIILLIFTVAFTFLQETALYTYTKKDLFYSIEMDDTGFYLSNLKKIYPFWIKSHLNLSYLENRFIRMLSNFEYFYLSIFILYVLVFLYLSRLVLKTINTAKAKKDSSIKELTVAFFLFLSAIPLLTLMLLSLTHKQQTVNAGSWTYVSEGRYYILSSVLFLVTTAWFSEILRNNGHKFSKNISTWATILILCYNTTLTLKFYINIISQNLPKKGSITKQERKSIEAIIDSLHTDKTTPMAITYNEPSFAYYPQKQNVALTSKINTLATATFHTSNRIQLLILAKNPLTLSDSILVKKTQAKKISTLHKTTIFLAEVLPLKKGT